MMVKESKMQATHLQPIEQNRNDFDNDDDDDNDANDDDDDTTTIKFNMKISKSQLSSPPVTGS